jgi:hypothetical protein
MGGANRRKSLRLSTLTVGRTPASDEPTPMAAASPTTQQASRVALPSAALDAISVNSSMDISIGSLDSFVSERPTPAREIEIAPVAEAPVSSVPCTLSASLSSSMDMDDTDSVVTLSTPTARRRRLLGAVSTATAAAAKAAGATPVQRLRSVSGAQAAPIDTDADAVTPAVSMRSISPGAPGTCCASFGDDEWFQMMDDAQVSLPEFSDKRGGTPSRKPMHVDGDMAKVVTRPSVLFAKQTAEVIFAQPASSVVTPASPLAQTVDESSAPTPMSSARRGRRRSVGAPIASVSYPDLMQAPAGNADDEAVTSVQMTSSASISTGAIFVTDDTILPPLRPSLSGSKRRRSISEMVATPPIIMMKPSFGYSVPDCISVPTPADVINSAVQAENIKKEPVGEPLLVDPVPTRPATVHECLPTPVNASLEAVAAGSGVVESDSMFGNSLFSPPSVSVFVSASPVRSHAAGAQSSATRSLQFRNTLSFTAMRSSMDHCASGTVSGIASQKQITESRKSWSLHDSEHSAEKVKTKMSRPCKRRKSVGSYPVVHYDEESMQEDDDVSASPKAFVVEATSAEVQGMTSKDAVPPTDSSVAASPAATRPSYASPRANKHSTDDVVSPFTRSLLFGSMVSISEPTASTDVASSMDTGVGAGSVPYNGFAIAATTGDVPLSLDDLILRRPVEATPSKSTSQQSSRATPLRSILSTARKVHPRNATSSTLDDIVVPTTDPSAETQGKPIEDMLGAAHVSAMLVDARALGSLSMVEDTIKECIEGLVTYYGKSVMALIFGEFLCLLLHLHHSLETPVSAAVTSVSSVSTEDTNAFINLLQKIVVAEAHSGREIMMSNVRNKMTNEEANKLMVVDPNGGKSCGSLSSSTASAGGKGGSGLMQTPRRNMGTSIPSFTSKAVPDAVSAAEAFCRTHFKRKVVRFASFDFTAIESVPDSVLEDNPALISVKEKLEGQAGSSNLLGDGSEPGRLAFLLSSIVDAAKRVHAGQPTLLTILCKFLKAIYLCDTFASWLSEVNYSKSFTALYADTADASLELGGFSADDLSCSWSEMRAAAHRYSSELAGMLASAQAINKKVGLSTLPFVGRLGECISSAMRYQLRRAFNSHVFDSAGDEIVPLSTATGPNTKKAGGVGRGGGGMPGKFFAIEAGRLKFNHDDLASIVHRALIHVHLGREVCERIVAPHRLSQDNIDDDFTPFASQMTIGESGMAPLTLLQLVDRAAIPDLAQIVEFASAHKFLRAIMTNELFMGALRSDGDSWKWLRLFGRMTIRYHCEHELYLAPFADLHAFQMKLDDEADAVDNILILADTTLDRHTRAFEMLRPHLRQLQTQACHSETSPGGHLEGDEGTARHVLKRPKKKPKSNRLFPQDKEDAVQASPATSLRVTRTAAGLFGAAASGMQERGSAETEVASAPSSSPQALALSFSEPGQLAYSIRSPKKRDEVLHATTVGKARCEELVNCQDLLDKANRFAYPLIRVCSCSADAKTVIDEPGVPPVFIGLSIGSGLANSSSASTSMMIEDARFPAVAEVSLSMTVSILDSKPSSSRASTGTLAEGPMPPPQSATRRRSMSDISSSFRAAARGQPAAGTGAK